MMTLANPVVLVLRLLLNGVILTVLIGQVSCSERSGHTAEPSVRQVGGSTMGTQWSVVWVDDKASLKLSTEHVQRQLDTELDRINALMSTWDPDSQLSRFNQAGHVSPVVLHDDTLRVIDAALEVSRLTSGRYDITLNPVIELWGFSRSTDTATPAQQSIDRALAMSGFRQLVRVGNTVRKRQAGVSIDVSSLAKGFAVDQLGMVVESLGIRHYLADIGGELRARGKRATDRHWRVGIENPHGDIPQVLRLSDTHIATSGSYRNFRMEGDTRLSHIIDGASGRPITHDLISVSVIHESTLLADAWATALLVVGADAALQLMQQQGIEAQLTVFRDNAFSSISSDGFAALLINGEASR